MSEDNRKPTAAVESTGLVAPKRRWHIELKAGADTREALLDIIDRVVEEMSRNEGIMGSTIGGGNAGCHYDVEDRGEEYTAERYAQDLHEWMVRKRATAAVSHRAGTKDNHE